MRLWPYFRTFHEAVEYLQIALGEFAAQGIDQVIVLGDLFEMGSRIDETCQILDAVNAIGVWGNHDYGLCVDPEDETREKYSAATIRFMTSVKTSTRD